MVFIDQRGTGCSTSYPDTETYESIFRSAHWGSRAIVQDAEAVREKLLGKESKWIVFGQSYGGFIVHRYVQMRPKSIITAHSHGMALVSDQFDKKRKRHESQRIVGQKFLEAFPGAGKVLSDIKSQLTEDTCVQYKKETPLCGEPILDGLTSYLGFTTAWPSLNSWLKSLINEDGRLDKSSLDRFHFEFNVSDSLDRRINWGAGIVSDVERWGDMGPAYGCVNIVEDFNLQGHFHSEWAFSECRQIIYYYELRKSEKNNEVDTEYEKYMASLERDDIDLQSFKKTLEENPDLKLFLYAGKLDSFVPPSVLDEELSVVKDLVTYREFETSGHEGFYTEDQIWKDILGQAE